MDLPSGTVTFLFTDVEGSTRLAKALGAARYGELLDTHRGLLRDAFQESGGIEVDSQGDSFFVAFRSAGDAVRAAAGAQHGLAGQDWPAGASVRVRMGIHTGEAAVGDGGYRGFSVHRAARICAAAHGGQVLMSSTTRDVVEADLPPEVHLRDLGLAQLRDIERPEQLFQLVVEGLPEAFPPPRAGPAPQVLASEVDLLERDAELAALDVLIAAAGLGGRLLAIEGPAGIGKSRLLAEARARAQQAGLRVLAARGSELELEFPYGVVRQLFEPLLASAPAEERGQLLSGAAELASPVFDVTRLGDEPDAASLTVLHGLFWLTANVTERCPLLVAIDDLHLCDRSSLRWLAYVLPRLEGLPVLVIAALRPAEPGADAGLISTIVGDSLATIVRLSALSEEATHLMLAAALASEVDAAFATALHEASGGNPLLVHQLASAVASEGIVPTASNAAALRELGGQAVARAVGLRMSRLSASARSLANAVAILGDDADARVAAALAALDAAAAGDAARELRRVDVLRPGVSLAFVHPVVRAAVYADLSAVERDHGHAAAARLLSESGAQPERVAAQLIFVAPTGDASTVRTLRAAARGALARGDPDGAVAYLRRALEEPPPDGLADVLQELGSAEVRVAAPEALDHLDAARAATGDVRIRALIALELGGPHLSTRQPRAKAVEILAEAIDELGDEDADLALQLENHLVGIARFQPTLYPVVGERLERLRALAPELPDGHDVIATLASESARAGVSMDEALGLAERALAGGSLMREHFDPAFLFAVGVFTASDRLHTASRLYGEAMDDARQRGLVAQFCIASCFRSAVAFHRGALADAVADAELCLGVLDSNRLEIVRPAAAGFLALALTERGEVEAAREALSAADVRVTEIEAYMYAWFFDARARLLLAEGDADRALDGLLSLGRYLDGIGVRNPALLAWRSAAALALLRLGRGDEARRYVDEELARARRWGAPRTLGKSLVAAGLVHGGEDGLALLHEAVAALEPSEAHLEHARALVELGSALRRANRRSDARAPLRRGLELATACGARPLAERAETELIATGARPRRIALSGVESLTPSERRVAEMAADGSTNREIAQALFVTAKTVEVHLSSVYRKLDIASRSQLSNALAVEH